MICGYCHKQSNSCVELESPILNNVHKFICTDCLMWGVGKNYDIARKMVQAGKIVKKEAKENELQARRR